MRLFALLLLPAVALATVVLAQPRGDSPPLDCGAVEVAFYVGTALRPGVAGRAAVACGVPQRGQTPVSAVFVAGDDVWVSAAICDGDPYACASRLDASLAVRETRTWTP